MDVLLDLLNVVEDEGYLKYKTEQTIGTIILKI